MEELEFDLAIVGAGPAGYVGAIRAAQLGARVALVEKDRIGGTCLNRGCIPSKALLHAAEAAELIQKAPNWGVKARFDGFNLESLRDFRDKTVEKMVKGVETLLKSYNIPIFQGEASFLDPLTLKVTTREGEQRIRARNFLVATGSEPAIPPISGANLPGVSDSDEITRLESIPSSIVIIGAGVIGMELATLYSSLGSKVTVLELLPRILPPADGAIASRFLALIKKRGVEVITSVKVEAIEPEGDKLKVVCSGEKPFHFLAEKVILAVGRRPYTRGLNLDGIGIELDKGFVKVNGYLQTSIPHIFAAGDCVGGALMAHKASYEGEIAVENALGHHRTPDYRAIPYCIYTFPEIAGVGLTEEEARKEGVDFEVASFPFTANARAWTMDSAEGVVRLICEKGSRKIIGAHIMGPWAGELIGELALAVRLELKAQEVAWTVHPHPSLSEAVMEAAKAAFYGEAIHYRAIRRR
ncbi:MAG: dihydrolipoyl dehydrogenase [Anaerolineae bacterium]|nr:dihydrolipoyl dehydrogenase [Anaerolineae bacterium]MDW8101792.1 dihydrolipoyl dehydrogenase [Anaerolineae bacterium]